MAWGIVEIASSEEVKLLRRYKRFLADVENSNGEKETVYCPNTGAMTGCDIPGSRAWLSNSKNIQRKFPKTLEFVETPAGIVGIRSMLANSLVEEAVSGPCWLVLRVQIEAPNQNPGKRKVRFCTRRRINLFCGS